MKVKINGERKSEAVSVSIAVDKLLRHYLDASYKNESIDITKIKTIDSSLESSVRCNIELCQYVYHIQPGGEANGLPGQPVDGNRITEGNFEALHQGVEFQLIPPIERIQSMEPCEPYPVVTNMWRS